MQIRLALVSDTLPIGQLVERTGMFTPEELPVLLDIVTRFHRGETGLGHSLAVAESPERELAGVIYFGPDAMTDRKWDLLMIAVDPAWQRKGVGTALLSFAEATATNQAARLMIVDTSSQSKYDKARSFYARNGYTEVARVPDYYTDGDHKVVMLKHFCRLVAP